MATWDQKRLVKVRFRLREFLVGVGRTGFENDHWSDTGCCYHLRRPLTDAEIALLDPAWLALPAIDPGDPGDPL